MFTDSENELSLHHPILVGSAESGYDIKGASIVHGKEKEVWKLNNCILVKSRLIESETNIYINFLKIFA
jgi:hypothetical protein